MSRLLLVGWDAADWKVIDPLIASGEMPNLAKLIREGVRGNLATIYPPLSPMLWTSIATGKRPHKHGIHGFTEPSSDGLSVRPVTTLGRKTKAIWNILHQTGKRSIVVGWWPSHPAEPIRGAMVSNHFPLAKEDAPGGPMAPGAVWPESRAKQLSELRVHPIEISTDILRMFVPDFEKIDQAKDKSLHDLASIISDTMSIHAAATELLATEPWDLAAIYHTGIDHFSHRFMRYHAGKARRDNAAEVLRDIVANAYCFHDVMLGRMLELAGPDCAVMVLSDHGFHSDALLPDYIPAEAAGPAVEHRHFGIFCMRGPGVHADGRVYGASVLDIAPTVLHLFGLPIGADMDGQVLVNAFQNGATPATIPSWELELGEDGFHPPGRRYDSETATESLKQLVALGYIAPPGGDAAENVARTVAEGRYNLARACIDGGRVDLAIPILRELIAADKEQVRFYSHLFHCYLSRGELAEAKRALESLDQAAEEFAPRAKEELTRRRAELPDAEVAKKEKADGRREMFERRGLAEKASAFRYERLLLRTRLALAGARTAEKKKAALALIEELAAFAGRRREPALFLAEAFAAAGADEKALTYVRRVLRADKENWHALGLEARIHQAAKRYDKAADRAIASLSLVYFQPQLHYLLGIALAQLGDTKRAEQELLVAASQEPGLIKAHEALAKLVRRERGRIGEASLHLARAQTLRKSRQEARARAKAANPRQQTAAPLVPAPASPVFERWDGSPPAIRSSVVTIVSGLPRSGTSMMMQMLVAGGLEAYSDGKREADEDNPRGYFEHEDAARVHEDTAWVPAARGKSVKIVAQLLPYLPATEQYRIILMMRNLEEVVASQRAMLSRLGRDGGRIDDAGLMRAYTGQLLAVERWLRSAPNAQVITVDYSEALKDPEGTSQRLASFLGAPFDAPVAAGSVDKGLRRQRSGSSVATAS